MAGALDRRRFRAFAARRCRRCRSRGAARANLDNQLGAPAIFLDELQDSLHMVLLEPVDNKAIWREEPEYAPVIHGLKGPNPGIELLLG